MTDEKKEAIERQQIREFCNALENVWLKHPSWTFNWLVVMTGITNVAGLDRMTQKLKENW